MTEDLRDKLAGGKNTFLRCLERYNVPTKDAVDFWEIAYLAGKMAEHERLMEEFKKFSKETIECVKKISVPLFPFLSFRG